MHVIQFVGTVGTFELTAPALFLLKMPVVLVYMIGSEEKTVKQKISAQTAPNATNKRSQQMAQSSANAEELN